MVITTSLSEARSFSYSVQVNSRYCDPSAKSIPGSCRPRSRSELDSQRRGAHFPASITFLPRFMYLSGGVWLIPSRKFYSLYKRVSDYNNWSTGSLNEDSSYVFRVL